MPFALLHGHMPTLCTTDHKTNLPTLTKRQEWLLAVCTRVQGAIKHAQCLLEGRTEHKRGQRHYHRYKQGDQVWLEGGNLWLSHPTAKLAPKRYSPFPITDVISPVVLHIRLPECWKIHNVFHVSLLTPFQSTEAYGQPTIPLMPELKEGHLEYEVGEILNLRWYGQMKRLQYLIRWARYSQAHDS